MATSRSKQTTIDADADVAPEWAPTDAERAAIDASRKRARDAQAALEEHMANPPELPRPEVIEASWRGGVTRWTAQDLVISRIEHGTESELGRWATLRNQLKTRAERAAREVLPDRPELAIAACDALKGHTRAELDARLLVPTLEAPTDGKARLTVIQGGTHAVGEFGTLRGALDFEYLRSVDHKRISSETIADWLTEQDWTISSGSDGGSRLFGDDHEIDSVRLEISRGLAHTPLIRTMPDDATVAGWIAEALRAASVRHARELHRAYSANSPSRTLYVEPGATKVAHKTRGSERVTNAHVVAEIIAPPLAIPLRSVSFGAYVNSMIGRHAGGRIVAAELVSANDVSNTIETRVRAVLDVEIVSLASA